MTTQEELEEARRLIEEARKYLNIREGDDGWSVQADEWLKRNK